MKSAADEGFHFPSCSKVIGIFKANRTDSWTAAGTACGEAGNCQRRQATSLWLQMMKARRSPRRPGGTSPGGRRSKARRERRTFDCSGRGSASFLLRFAQHSRLAEFGKGLLWEGNAQMSQLARPRSDTVPLAADHRLFLRVLG